MGLCDLLCCILAARLVWSKVNRLLPHIDSGLAPVDLRYANGMKKADESEAKMSVEGFLTFLYHFVAPWLCD